MKWAEENENVFVLFIERAENEIPVAAPGVTIKFTNMCAPRSINRAVERYIPIKLVVMINRSQKFILCEFLSIIGHN